MRLKKRKKESIERIFLFFFFILTIVPIDDTETKQIKNHFELDKQKFCFLNRIN